MLKNLPTYYRSGAYTSVYKSKKKMFKAFDSKSEAIFACDTQQRLSVNNLAPEVRSNVKRIRIRNYNPGESEYRLSNWGYYTEIAKIVTNHELCDCVFCNRLEISLAEKMTQLCDNIRNYVGLEFLDCHLGNLGYITRNEKKLLVCIDTGMQSFGVEQHEDYDYA